MGPEKSSFLRGLSRCFKGYTLFNSCPYSRYHPPTLFPPKFFLPLRNYPPLHTTLPWIFLCDSLSSPNLRYHSSFPASPLAGGKGSERERERVGRGGGSQTVVFALPRRPRTRSLRWRKKPQLQVRVILILLDHGPLDLEPKFVSVHFSWKNLNHSCIKFVEGDMTQKA